jgi:hypoxanthine phosphoribosyltransferase
MSSTSYDYANRAGVRPISWDAMFAICKGLALAASKYDPEMILGVARGGMYPGTLLSHLLQKEFYPVRLTRRVNDVVRYNQPIWSVRPPATIKGQRVLIVDEICDSGETLAMVKDEALKVGASEARIAVLYAHIRGKDIPDYVGIVTDELLLNPWDREILKDGRFVFHPEYVGALEQQGIAPEPSLLLGVEPVKLARER